MAKLIFLRRTENEICLLGGDVYIDIDGKNVGILSRTNQEFTVSAGKHAVRMYKSHKYDTFIGFAESVFDVETDEQLMIRYSAPVATNQPGNLIVSNYDSSKEDEILRDRERAIQKDYTADLNRKHEQNNKYNTGVLIFIAFLVVDAIVWAIWMLSIF